MSKTIKQKATSPPHVTVRGGKCTPPPRALGLQTMRNSFTLRHVITGHYVSPPKCLFSGGSGPSSNRPTSFLRLRPTWVLQTLSRSVYSSYTSSVVYATHTHTRTHARTHTHTKITLRATCLAKDSILHANALLLNKSYTETRRNVSKLQKATSGNFLLKMKRISDYTNARKHMLHNNNGKTGDD